VVWLFSRSVKEGCRDGLYSPLFVEEGLREMCSMLISQVRNGFGFGVESFFVGIDFVR
jgi:hypothetical protein